MSVKLWLKNRDEAGGLFKDQGDGLTPKSQLRIGQRTNEKRELCYWTKSDFVSDQGCLGKSGKSGARC